MTVTSEFWYAFANPDGTYGEPQPFDGIAEFPDIETPEQPPSIFRSYSGTMELGHVTLSKYARVLLGIDPWPRIWELRRDETKRRLRRV